MRQGFLILHGIGNHRPPQHWQFLLAAALTERGHEVRYPQLPDADGPELEDWLIALEAELALLSDTRVTVVCHSLACSLWFHAAALGRVGQVDRVLLVSPPASDRIPFDGESFRLESLDAEAVRRSAASELAMACSDDDPYNLTGAQTMYGDALGLTATVVPGGAHITPDSGFGPWPFALDWCLHPAGRRLS